MMEHNQGSESVDPRSPSEEKLVSILDILKSYEPSGWADGRPMGYDLATDNRTEFGFYWEYDQMEEAAKQINDLIREETHKARIEELDGVLLASQTLDSSSGILDAVERRIAELKGAGE